MRRRFGTASTRLLLPSTVAGSRGRLFVSSLRPNTTLAATAATNDVAASPINTNTLSKGTFFVDLILPIRLTVWDIRGYLAAFRERDILDSLTQLLETVHSHRFKLLRVDPSRTKDGGVFVQFEYDSTSPAPDTVPPLERIRDEIRAKAKDLGGLPSWLGLRRSDVWIVRGEPWTEDMHRYASATLKVDFEGPDVHQETLYRAFRPFGMIEDISRPTPVPAGALRSSIISFDRVKFAVRAQNCLHGFVIPGNGANTRLSIAYEQKLKGHVVRDWLSSHPKIVLPMLAFFLGTLTYTIFDPVRSFMVQAKVENWLDYRDYAAVQWLRRNTIDKLSIDFSSSRHKKRSNFVWEERKEAESDMERYLNDIPTTVAFLHGPAGSGKSTLINRLLAESKRPYIVIDCAALYSASSDAAVLRQIATQTGYFPVFSGLAWVNSMIDLASVGLIGQKAGFSKSLDEQLKEVLDVVGSALKRVNSNHVGRTQANYEREEALEKRKATEAERLRHIRVGIFHDPRLDALAGNGIMCELGIGDERLDDFFDSDTTHSLADASSEQSPPRSTAPAHDLSGLPIVVLKNYDARGATKREAILEVLANWSTALIENQIAHVVVASNNRESTKRLAKALGTRPIASVALLDADTNSALSIVSSRLREADAETTFTSTEVGLIQRLGGRSSDLDALVYKVKNGLSVEDAVEDIIIRTMGKLRKNAFGDDNEDAKTLPWNREQAWSVISKLAARSEIPYSGTLLEFPFKGDDASLREMEKAELISIVTDDGFPVSIRPGRPVYRYVFERLVNDTLFSAVQEVAVNEKLIVAAEATVRACEDELITLRTIGLDAGKSIWHGKGATGLRADVLLRKMEQAVDKVEKLERANVRLKKTLANQGLGRGLAV